MKWFSKKSVKRLSSAVAFSIVTGLNMGGAEAAKFSIIDVSEQTEEVAATSRTEYLFKYDKSSDTLKGATINIGDNKQYNFFLIRVEDIKGLSPERIEQLFNDLGSKAVNANKMFPIKAQIIDKENKVVLEGFLNYNAGTQKYEYTLPAYNGKSLVFTEQLKIDDSDTNKPTQYKASYNSSTNAYEVDWKSYTNASAIDGSARISSITGRI